MSPGKKMLCPVCGSEMKTDLLVNENTYANVDYYRCQGENHCTEVMVRL